MKTNLIKLVNVSKIYGKGSTAVHALKNINLEIEKGEFIAIMGASGSGKSTLLNLLGCLDAPSSGSYLFSGIQVEKLSHKQRSLIRRHFIGFVFQNYNLLPRTRAIENVELPLIYRKVNPAERRRLARKALDLVGLSAFEHHTPAELSGGQQQRVAIARAIVTNPLLLLADEPTGNLDTKKSHEIMELLTHLNVEKHFTVVLVSHEPEMAAYANRIIHFEDGTITHQKTGK